MKRLVMPFVIVGVIILLVAGYFWCMNQSASTDAPKSETDPLVEAATLAIKGISLFQGEKGFEFWRLKAEWAAMSQEKDIIDVKEPKVRYTLGEPSENDYVFATSDLGRVSDNQSVLTMWDNVVLTRGEDRLTGPEMVYRTSERIVRFPKTGRLDRPTMHGTFGVLIWSMDANTVEATDGVDITFVPANTAPAEGSPRASEAEPASVSEPVSADEAAPANETVPTDAVTPTDAVILPDEVAPADEEPGAANTNIDAASEAAQGPEAQS